VISLHVTCGLTACTPGSAPDPTLGNEYGKTLPFLPYVSIVFVKKTSFIPPMLINFFVIVNFSVWFVLTFFPVFFQRLRLSFVVLLIERYRQKNFGFRDTVVL